MNPKLIAISGPAQGVTFLLTIGEAALGREPTNHVCIADALLSRRHCRITLEDEIFTLHDLESRNGTFVNGVPVKERRLAHQDVIKLGDSLLVFLCRPEGEDGLLGAVRLENESSGMQPTLAFDRGDSLYLNAEKLRAEASQAGRLAENFQALLRLGLEISAIRDLKVLALRLLDLIGALIPAERSALLLTDKSGEITSTFSWRRHATTSAPVSVSRTLVERVLNEGVALMSRRVQTEFQAAASLRESCAQAVIVAPLAVTQQVFGVLYLETSDATASFTDDHQQLVTAIAGLAATALDNARYVEQERAEAHRLQGEINADRKLIGEGPAMNAVREFIAKIAVTDANVLLCGESGVGKEVVARALHEHSRRTGKPFVAINCAALPAELVESELFGHERGSFTGAYARKIGKFEVAQGGTIFLDEIGELQPAFQAKLLRVLQERELERIGGTHPIKLDVRVLAATNKDLEAAIRNGTFRADLFYRLKVVSLTVPSLRERREDIPLLAGYFVTKHSRQVRRRVKGLAQEARECLQRYDWPGNVRELENAIQRALAWGTTEFILPDDLPDEVLEAEAPDAPMSAPFPTPLVINSTEPLSSAVVMNFHEAVKEAKKQIIVHAIRQADGNYQEAAQQLGILPNNLHRLIRNLNLKGMLKATTRD